MKLITKKKLENSFRFTSVIIKTNPSALRILY